MDVILKDREGGLVSIEPDNAFSISKTLSLDSLIDLHCQMAKNDQIGLIPHNLKAIFDLRPLRSKGFMEEAIFVFEDPPMYRDILFKDGMKYDKGEPESYRIPLPWMYYLSHVYSYNDYTNQEVYVAFSVERITDWSDRDKPIRFSLPNLIHINDKVYFCLPDSFYNEYCEDRSIQSNQDIIDLASAGVKSYWHNVFNNNATNWIDYNNTLIEHFGTISFWRIPLAYLNTLQDMSIQDLLLFDHHKTGVSIEDLCVSIASIEGVELESGPYFTYRFQRNISDLYLNVLRKTHREL